jgi:DNA-binding response OmpR family regulator
MHVALIGPELMYDASLITTLCSEHVVTMSRTAHALASTSLLPVLDVLVLDAGQERHELSTIVRSIRERDPHVTLLLVNGGLDQLEIAEAFRLGVTDYFARPWNERLLVERIEVLAARRRATTGAVTTLGEPQ